MLYFLLWEVLWNEKAAFGNHSVSGQGFGVAQMVFVPRPQVLDVNRPVHSSKPVCGSRTGGGLR